MDGHVRGVWHPADSTKNCRLSFFFFFFAFPNAPEHLEQPLKCALWLGHWEHSIWARAIGYFFRGAQTSTYYLPGS